MAEMFTDLAGWMESLPVFWAYVTLLAIAFGENVIPPIPGDVAILYGGYLVGIGKLSFWPVVGLATLGGALGFMALYGLGFRVGEAVLDPNRLRWVPKQGVEKARVWVARWGWWVVLFNRFLSGIRSVISLTVGIARMDARRTALLAAASAFAWTLLIVYAGYALGDNLDLVKKWMAAYGRIVGSLITLFVLVWLVRKVWQRRKAR